MSRVRVNPHGVFGVAAVAVMLIILALRRPLPDYYWAYAVLSIGAYAVAVIRLTMLIEKSEEDEVWIRSEQKKRSKYASEEDFNRQIESIQETRFTPYRVLIGTHLAFIFLTIGLAIGFDTWYAAFGTLLASVAGGLAIPFLLLKRERYSG